MQECKQKTDENGKKMTVNTKKNKNNLKRIITINGYS